MNNQQTIEGNNVNATRYKGGLKIGTGTVGLGGAFYVFGSDVVVFNQGNYRGTRPSVNWYVLRDAGAAQQALHYAKNTPKGQVMAVRPTISADACQIARCKKLSDAVSYATQYKTS